LRRAREREAERDFASGWQIGGRGKVDGRVGEEGGERSEHVQVWHLDEH